MAFSESSLSTLFVGTSTTVNVEPTTYQTMQPTAHSIAPTSSSFEDETLDPSGEAIDQFRFDKAGQGDISGHFRPTQWDGMISAVQRSAFGSALSLTLTVSFGTPTALGLQTITDDGTDGFATVAKGDSVFVGGAIASALNGGLRTVLARTDDQLTVYNPTGVLSAADAGVTFVHSGVSALGTSTIYAWIERMRTDGVAQFFSEWFKNGKVTSWQHDFPAKGPSRTVFNVQSDSPVFRRANGSPPILKQRGGTDTAVTGDRLVHSMEDVREIVLYDSAGVVLKRFDDTNAANFGWTIGRQVRQDSVVGTSAIVNTSVSRPKIDIRLQAFVDDNSSYLTTLWDNYPDGCSMHCIWGAAPTAAETGANSTAYGIWFDGVRAQQIQDPTQGNNQADQFNGTLSALRARVTRF